MHKQLFVCCLLGTANSRTFAETVAVCCIGSDVIFFIYLYQRWIYPMDPNRINEFGVSKQMLDKTEGIATPESNGQLLLEDQASIETSRPAAAATAEPETSGTRQRRRNMPTTQEN
ncbi:hypothetical protein X801_05883 [Opisthorchis viverrini]|uniref:Cleft lip and palate transmembrane protein 1 n=1 Tax=Opisthorchis viverrini TaxID=6198 RepID=A0A1S8WVJ6_OPIVI|nr:hypothetical protein X801_05883 [Opisthorchis viverrini]